MKIRMKKFFALVMVLTLILNTIGCNNGNKKEADISVTGLLTPTPTVSVTQMLPTPTERVVSPTEGLPTPTAASYVTNVPTHIPDLNSDEPLFISTNWEDYIGDIETLVYGLMVNELKMSYDVFPASVFLADGTEISGIGFTDYSEGYENEEEEECYFAAGFIPYKGEFDIPDADFENGLFIYDVSYNTDKSNLIMQYKSDKYIEHCVAYNQYIKYGIDENGQLFYENEDFDKKICDESLGDLYSYDESRFVLRTEFGNYSYISGTSLTNLMDYDKLEKEINDIIKNQDKNMVSIETETYVTIAKERVEAYFMNLQTESFMGYDPLYLAELASEIDDDECIRILNEGFTIIDKNYGQEASTLVRFLVGAACIVTAVVGMVCSVAFMAAPGLSALTGAITGTAIELFVQISVSGTSLGNVEWGKVALAAATGAICGFMGPYIFANTSGIGYFFADSCMDGIVGGLEKGVSAWLDGESGMEIVKSIGYGAALGFGLSAGFKLVGEGLGAAAGKFREFAKKHDIEDLGEKLFPTLTKNVSKLKNFINDKIIYLKEIADKSIFHNKYLAEKITIKQVKKLLENPDYELLDKSINELTVKNPMLDLDDSNIVIPKDDFFKQLARSAPDDSVLAQINIDGEIIYVIKKNNIVGIVFDKSVYQTVDIPGGLLADRPKNFENAAKELKDNWLKNPDSIPESIKNDILEWGKNSGDIDDILENLTPKRLATLIQNNKEWVLHENIDLISVTLVKRVLHDKGIGGAAHTGGFALAKYLKEHIAEEFYDRFLGVISSAAS